MCLSQFPGDMLIQQFREYGYFPNTFKRVLEDFLQFIMIVYTEVSRYV